MRSFRLSSTARWVSLSAAILLAGGGAVAAFHVHSHLVLPIFLVLGIGSSIVGMVLGTEEHSTAVALLAFLLPLLLWPYVMALEWVVTTSPQLGWLLVAAGVVVLGMSVASSATSAESPEGAKLAAGTTGDHR